MTGGKDATRNRRCARRWTGLGVCAEIATGLTVSGAARARLDDRAVRRDGPSVPSSAMSDRAHDDGRPEVDAIVVAYGNEDTIRACVAPLCAAVDVSVFVVD